MTNLNDNPKLMAMKAFKKSLYKLVRYVSSDDIDLHCRNDSRVGEFYTLTLNADACDDLEAQRAAYMTRPITVEREEITEDFFKKERDGYGELKNWIGYYQFDTRFRIGSASLYKWLTLDDAPFTERDSIGNVRINGVCDDELGFCEHTRFNTSVRVFDDVTYNQYNLACLTEYINWFLYSTNRYDWTYRKVILVSILKTIKRDVEENKNSAQRLYDNLITAKMENNPHLLKMDNNNHILA